ncbi:hypothetical protein [Streptomyces fagopyri]|uniref:hypothetical protein n=1 Tax=Streptomyces fagopyri TaxID=2662397 RepID=UPI003712A040
MTAFVPLRLLPDKIATREQALTAEIALARARIDEPTGRLSELAQEAEHLRITRGTVLAFSGDLDAPPSAVPPEHPAYQQLLAAFARRPRPMRARDQCQVLDLDTVPKNIESTRHKLKRFVGRGILTWPEPGLFNAPRV